MDLYRCRRTAQVRGVGRRSIVMIEHERHTQSGKSPERRFYISSLVVEAPEMPRLKCSA